MSAGPKRVSRKPFGVSTSAIGLPKIILDNAISVQNPKRILPIHPNRMLNPPRFSTAPPCIIHTPMATKASPIAASPINFGIDRFIFIVCDVSITKRNPSLKHNHLTDRVARCQPLESLVDAVQPDTVGHQFLDGHRPGLHQPRETRNIAQGHARPDI